MGELSVDLRQRVVAHYEKTEGATYEATAARYGVGEASVSRWLRLKRETGCVAVRPRKKTSRFKVELEWLKAHAEANPDARLKDRVAAYLKEKGVACSIPGMWGALHALGFTHKKRPSTRRSVSERMSNASARNTSKNSLA